ncbi:hypothetical protein Droror1_Dr00015553 [Drosera rotundifolia]
MDPYAVLSVRSQEQKSNVATGNGSEPEWNETFVFTISGDAPELIIELMDKDNFSADDFVGEATKPSSVVSSVKPDVNKFPLIPEFLKFQFVKTMILELELLVLIKSFQLRKSLCALQISGILIRKNDLGKESILEESSSSHRLQTLQVFGSYLSSV